MKIENILKHLSKASMENLMCCIRYNGMVDIRIHFIHLKRSCVHARFHSLLTRTTMVCGHPPSGCKKWVRRKISLNDEGMGGGWFLNISMHD